MKVFLSWSGDRSRRAAEALRDWLPQVLQACEPYFSPDDVRKGAVWFTEIAHALQESSFGIVCVTRENAGSPWMLFEAGAMALGLTRAHVSPLLINIPPSNVVGPLAQLQSTSFDRDEILRLVASINDRGDRPIATDLLRKTFDRCWPDLERELSNAAAMAITEPAAAQRPEADILDELLTLTRLLASGTLPPRTPTVSQAEVSDYRQRSMQARGLIFRHRESPVNTLPMLPASASALMSAGIQTVGELVIVSHDDLVSRFGSDVAADVIKAMAVFGLTPARPTPP